MSPEEKAALQRRIAALGDKLGEIRLRREADARAETDAELRGRGMSYGLRMAAELVSAVLVGGFIGYALDTWLGSKPWLFLVFFMLGFAAGIVNVLRAFQRMQREFAARTGGRTGHAVKDEDD
jgi:ATP synthase protein I